MKKIKAIFCVLFGHSNIQDGFFGYWYCGRCEDQVGDSLGSLYWNANQVVIGHNCDKCRENYRKLSWKDKFLTPNPFVDNSTTSQIEG